VYQANGRFPGVPSSVSAARRFVSDSLESGGAAGDGWTAVQIVSELATNAIVHAGTSFVVGVEVGDAVVRVSVTDERPASRAAKRHFAADSTTGRGLRLVETLARSWGVDSDHESKTVWCEFARTFAGQDGDGRPATHVAADQLQAPGQGSWARSSTPSSGEVKAFQRRRAA
jgi:anti-sigma regulatory factor (Ser/Thr protein kinase)